VCVSPNQDEEGKKKRVKKVKTRERRKRGRPLFFQARSVPNNG